MKCEEVEKMMIDYLDHSLEETEQKEMEQHLENCERCLDEIKDLEKVLAKMETGKMEMPDESLRINFYHMLHDEIKKAESGSPALKGYETGHTIRLMMKIAAAVILFVAGTVTGALLINKGDGRAAQITELKSEMDNMKKLVMLNMLKDGSASQRIQAVSYTDGLSRTDPQVLNALARTLNEDKNINVRIAAAYSLSKFAYEQSVRDTLVKSLGSQTEPIIQVILMNILVDIKEHKAVPSMQKIVSDQNTLKEVKDVAQKSIGVLL